MIASNGKHPLHWLDEYVEAADAKSPMTPRAFHEGIGLWLIATTIARRLVVRMAHDDVYPSLWLMLLARSTLYSKTTALNLSRSMMHRSADKALLLPDAATPEALVDLLAGSGQRGMIIDEASGILSTSERDYMAGHLELLMRLYDSPGTYSRVTKGGGTSTISNGYLTLLAASTPALMRRHLRNERLWAAGFWPRFGILMPPAEIPPFRRAQFVDETVLGALAGRLITLGRRLPPVTQPLDVQVERAAMDGWMQFDEWARYTAQPNLSDAMSAAHGRAPTTALKIATCLAAMEWTGVDHAPRIEPRHMERAMAIARAWLEGALQAFETAQKAEPDKDMDLIQRAIQRAGGEWVSLRDLCRATHLKASDVERGLVELEAAGAIVVEQVKRGGQTSAQARIVSIEGVEEVSLSHATP